MSVLFEPLQIRGLRLPNRFMRSATHDGCSSQRGEITEKSLELFSGLARGGIGLIVTGYANVHPTGQTFWCQTAVHSDSSIPGLRRLADTVHRLGGRVALQVAHGGRISYAVRARGEAPPGPSLVQDDPLFSGLHREMTDAEIEEIIGAFGDAARRAREAGFDAVQLHGAHSYLFAQFLSPRSNRRTDRWGGSLENRMRFHLEVVGAIRRAVGRDYPLLIKLGAQDGVEGGLTLAEGAEVARGLVAAGIDSIEVSEGLEESRGHHIRKGVKLRENEAYYAAWAKETKKVVSVPVFAVGGMRSFDIMERTVTGGCADGVSMCRPFIREPGIVLRWQAGDLRPSSCISCNRCVLERSWQEQPVECVQDQPKIPAQPA